MPQSGRNGLPAQFRGPCAQDEPYIQSGRSVRGPAAQRPGARIFFAHSGELPRAGRGLRLRCHLHQPQCRQAALVLPGALPLPRRGRRMCGMRELSGPAGAGTGAERAARRDSGPHVQQPYFHRFGQRQGRSNAGEPCVRYGAQEHCLHPRRTHGRHRKPLRQLLQDLLRPGAAGARRLCTRRRLPRLRQLRTHHRRAAGAAAAAHMHLFHR